MASTLSLTTHSKLQEGKLAGEGKDAAARTHFAGAGRAVRFTLSPSDDESDTDSDADYQYDETDLVQGVENILSILSMLDEDGKAQSKSNSSSEKPPTKRITADYNPVSTAVPVQEEESIPVPKNADQTACPTIHTTNSSIRPGQQEEKATSGTDDKEGAGNGGWWSIGMKRGVLCGGLAVVVGVAAWAIAGRSWRR